RFQACRYRRSTKPGSSFWSEHLRSRTQRLFTGGLSMQDQAAKMAYLIRTMRIAFFISGILFIYVMFRLPSQAQASPAHTVEWAITIMSLVCVAMGFVAPRFLAGAIRTQGSPGSNPFQKQFTMTILSLAFFEAAVLFGFVLHFLGAHVLF